MIELRGLTWDHPRGFQPLQACVEPYAARFGVRISWQVRSLKDFGDAPLSELARRFDLLIVDHPHMGEATATDCLFPLDNGLSAEILATLAAQSAGPSHASYTYAGHQWALASDAAMQTACCRPDLLESPLPATWDEVFALAERVRGRGYTIALPLCPTDALCSFLSLCASLGTPPEGRETLVGEETGLAALHMLKRLYQLSPSFAANWTPIQLLDAMSHTDEIIYCPLAFCYTNYARDGYAPHRIAFGTVPGVKGALLGGAGIAVSACSRHIEAACAYAAWLASAEVQQTLYVENGGQPGNRLAWESDHANALTHDFFRHSRATLDAAYMRPRFYGWHIFQERAGDVIHDVLVNDGSAATCLTQLARLYSECHAMSAHR